MTSIQYSQFQAGGFRAIVIPLMLGTIGLYLLLGGASFVLFFTNRILFYMILFIVALWIMRKAI